MPSNKATGADSDGRLDTPRGSGIIIPTTIKIAGMEMDLWHSAKMEPYI
jgi:hypothetical protein